MLSNIFLEELERVKIGDLGLARNYESLEKMNDIRGTFNYMSPEFFRNDKNLKVDFKTDIWSFGCVLYEMINLERAFIDTDFEKLKEKISTGQYAPSDDIKPEYQEILDM